MSRVARLDRFQRRHAWVGFPVAVVYKFFDDRGAYLAALITYYSFVSLFPLLLLSFSILGFVLQGNPELLADVERTVRTELPGIGPHLNIGTFHGSGPAVVIGVLGTLYGALGAMQAAQAGFNRVYAVPRNEQPNPIKSRIRSFGLVGLLGSGVLLSTGISAVLATANGLSKHIGPAVHVGGYILNYAVNFALFSAAFQLLTAKELRLRQVVRGGLVAAGLYLLLQIFGSKLVSHTAKASLYKAFAVVLVTLAWLYLQSLILILSAEINVVQDRSLWPRALLTPFTDDVQLTDADRLVYTLYATAQQFKGFEHVDVEFGDGAGADAEAKHAPGAQAERDPTGSEERTGAGDGNPP